MSVTELDNGVLVNVHRGEFPWERFAIAIVIIPPVCYLILTQGLGWFSSFTGSDIDVQLLQRVGITLLLVMAYFTATFHGLHLPGDSFSYFLSSAFHRFSIEANSRQVVIRKYWLLRRSTRQIPINQVQSFAVHEGWFVCQTQTQRIVICDGPPKSVITKPLAALNRVVEQARQS